MSPPVSQWEQENRVKESLRKRLDELLSTPPKEYVREKELGSEMDFKPALSQIERTLSGYRVFKSENPDLPSLIQNTVVRILVVSILFSVMLWSGGMYKAHRHNHIVNRHRANALSTFQAFAESTSDGQTKNAVLLQETNCIFMPQASGYSSKESQQAMQPQIFEVVRNIAGKQDSA
jgi:hypothetical protein